jgi:DNA-binding transcriptional LysR family regulator
LQLLQTVARTGSYSATARELGFTQPAISYQMRCLEREIGAPLTIRAGASMQLTAVGQALLEHADAILAAVRNAERELAAMVGSNAGTIKMGAFPSSCATLVPAAIAQVTRALPAVDVRLLQVEPPQCHDLVRRGELALGLSYRFGGSDEHRERIGQPRRIPLFLDEVRLMLPVDHAAARRKLVRIADLADETWILAGRRRTEGHAGGR